MAQNNLDAQLQAAIQAAKAGERERARSLLEGIVSRDTNNELAWIWLASVVTTSQERRICLERVLEINPRNQRARQALSQLGGLGASGQSVNAEQVAGGMRTGNSALINLLIVVAVLAVGALILTLLSPRSATVVLPSPTPLPQEAVMQFYSPTPAPTLTPPIVVVTRSFLPTLAPSFTPTPTLTPSVTPTLAPTALPASEYVVFFTARQATSLQTDLWRVRADGTDEALVANNLQDFSFGFTGQEVVFVHPVQGTAPSLPLPAVPEATAELGLAAPATPVPAGQAVNEIFIAPADNLEAAQQVSQLVIASAYAPRLSPDGTKIAFYSPYDGDDELWLLDVATQVVEKLTDNEGIVDRDPAWSPDGKHLVFASDRQSPGFADLFILSFNDDGSTQVRLLIDNPSTSTAPVWSPDGRWIAYLNDREGDNDVWLVDAQGQRNQIITVDASAEDRAPTWSPDARYIAFISNAEDEQFQLYLYERESRQTTRLTRNTLEVQALSFRPDLLIRLRLQS